MSERYDGDQAASRQTSPREPKTLVAVPTLIVSMMGTDIIRGKDKDKPYWSAPLPNYD